MDEAERIDLPRRRRGRAVSSCGAPRTGIAGLHQLDQVVPGSLLLEQDFVELGPRGFALAGIVGAEQTHQVAHALGQFLRSSHDGILLLAGTPAHLFAINGLRRGTSRHMQAAHANAGSRRLR